MTIFSARNRARLAAVAVMGAAASAVAFAPTAAADDRVCGNSGGATICTRNGHAAINAAPGEVSPPRSYGQFSSPAPFIFFD